MNGFPDLFESEMNTKEMLLNEDNLLELKSISCYTIIYITDILL